MQRSSRASPDLPRTSPASPRTSLSPRSFAAVATASLLAGVAAVAFAAPAAAGSAWILSVGGEVDEESGYRFDAGAIWVPVESTSVSVLGARADSSTDFDEFTSTTAIVAVDHHFDPVGLSLEARWREDSDFLEALTWAGSLYLRTGPWRISLRGETRSTDFEPMTFSNVVIPRDGVPVQVSATSECGLDNTAYGAGASYTGSVWSVRLSGTQYDYDDADCEFTNVTPPSFARFLRLRPNLLPLIAPRLALFQRLQRSSITRESTFLDSTLSAGLGLRAGPRTWELDYYHDREQFEGLESDTLIAGVTLPTGERADLELRLGLTDSDVVGNVAFVGFTLYGYLGGD